jgi:hypothetical protein
VGRLRGILTALLALVRARLSGAETAFHQDGDLQATNVAELGTEGADAVAPGATLCGPAARAHERPPVLVLAHALRLIRRTRGTAGAELGLGLSVGARGVTVGMTSEIAGPGLQRSLLCILVSSKIALVLNCVGMLVYILQW